MKFIPLSPTDRKYNLATHKVVLDYTDLVGFGSGTTGTVQIFPRTGNFPAGTVARFAGLRLTTAFGFSDVGINSLLVEVGDTGSTARLLSQTQIAAAGTPVTNKVEPGNTQPYAYPSATSIGAKFTVAGGASPTLGEATSGVVELYLHMTDQANLGAANSP